VKCKIHILFILAVLTGIHGFSQNQNVADSLVEVYQSLPNGDTARLRILTLIANNQTDPRKKLDYSFKLLEEAEAAQSYKYLHHAYLNEGQAYRLSGDFDVAIYSLFKALNFAEKADYISGVAASNTALADVYSILDNHNSSVMYYKKALRVVAFRDSTLLANILLNLGDEYYMANMYDSALNCFNKSKSIYEELGNNQSGIAYNLGNIGLVEAEKGELDLAEQNIAGAIDLLSEMGDQYGIAIFLSYMSEIYHDKGKIRQAKIYADSSMRIAKKYGLKTEIRDNSLRLADIYATGADFESAYKYHQQYVALKDSISNDEIYSRIENLESAFELAKKQSEVNLLKVKERNQRMVIVTVIFVALVLTVLAIVIYRYYRSKAKVNRILEDQKFKLEQLNKTKDKFFSIISHDLRGPISSFHGVSNMIKFFVKNNDKEQLLEIADHIDKSVDGLSSLLDNLLTWAMQQQGRFPNAPERIDIKDVCDDIILAFSNMAKSKNIKIESSVTAGKYVWVDKNAAMTIIRNLVNNALKFTNEEGVIFIKAAEDNSMLKVEIIDSGVGMSKEKVNNLFKIEESRSSYGTSGEKGLGLGLQLVHEFVEMVQGKITVESDEGKGTKFSVWLPVENPNI